MNKVATVERLIAKHRALDIALRNDRDSFLSDWNATHPFVDEFLGPALADVEPRSSAGDYIYLDERPAIIQALLDLHEKLESLSLDATNVLAGPGSSSILAAFALWLAQRGSRQIYYIPPLYHTLHFFLAMLNITAIPISRKQVFETGFDMNLPTESTILLLCDPIWYAGKRVPFETIAAISLWQEQTDSLVFVDGSFQYLQWYGTRAEHTSMLNTERTFRLVCPTKSLGVHSFRFSYLLHPGRFHEELVFLYESLVGSVSVGNLTFARRALHVLSSDRTNRSLTDFLKTTYQELLERGYLRTQITPDCGYYVFAIPTVEVDRQIAMGEEYFELTGYAGHVRINLMVARRIYLGS